MWSQRSIPDAKKTHGFDCAKKLCTTLGPDHDLVTVRSGHEFHNNDNDNDNDTLIEDESNMCWTSGPAGMSDGVMTLRKSIGHLDRR